MKATGTGEYKEDFDIKAQCQKNQNQKRAGIASWPFHEARANVAKNREACLR